MGYRSDIRIMTDKEKIINKELFKQQFSKYCESEIAAGHCCENDCLWCPVNMAWDKIFCCDEDEYEDD